MENGYFRNHETKEFQFSGAQAATEDVPARTVSVEFSKSATIQALISQNEDLMARLKVTLQRLTKEEDEAARLQKELSTIKASHASIHDQLLIWKEKERVWKERNEKLEKTCSTLEEKVKDHTDYQDQLLIWKEKERIWKEQNENLEARCQTLQGQLTDQTLIEQKLTRYQRFHEKLKTQVKPYIRQLKDYAQSLQSELAQANKTAQEKDGALAVLTQDLEIAKNLRHRSEESARAHSNELIDSFEKERSFLLKELSGLKDHNAGLSNKAELLVKAEDRIDSLENQVIAMRRHQEEQANSYREEIQDIREDHKHLKQLLIQKELECKTQLEQLTHVQALHEAAAGKLQEAEEQVLTTRYLWKNKTDELEQLQIAMHSLERLNRELSQKMAELSQNHPLF